MQVFISFRVQQLDHAGGIHRLQESGDIADGAAGKAGEPAEEKVQRACTNQGEQNQQKNICTHGPKMLLTSCLYRRNCSANSSGVNRCRKSRKGSSGSARTNEASHTVTAIQYATIGKY